MNKRSDYMKKKIAQKCIAVLSTVILLFSMGSLPAHAYYTPPEEDIVDTYTIEGGIRPFADFIETYYRYVNDVLQKRRWNATRGYWVDPAWVVVP